MSLSFSLAERAKTEITIVVELDPPKSPDLTKYLNGAVALQEAGADAITIADNSVGQVRVSNLAVASILKNMGIEPLVHVACRDRNLIGQQSHLLGLHVLGIHHVLLVTGDPIRISEIPTAKPVFDTTSLQLTSMVKELMKGNAFTGQTISPAPQFVVGTAFNPHVAQFDKAIERLERKLDAGADYVMTQPIYDIRLFEKLICAVEAYDVPVFVGIMPVTSLKNAMFLRDNVPGIGIPEALLTRMASVPAEEGKHEGLRIAEELVDEALHYFKGIYLVTPFLRYDLTVELTKYIRSRQCNRSLEFDRKLG